jgi:hypothetical protein
MLTTKVDEIRTAQIEMRSVMPDVTQLKAAVNHLELDAAEHRGARRIALALASALGIMGGAAADFFSGVWRHGH